MLGSVGQRDVNKDSPAQPANSVLNLDAVTGQQVWPKLPGSAPTMTSSEDSNGPQPTNHSDGNDVRGIPGTYQSSMHSETRWSALTSTPQGSNRFAALADVDSDGDHDHQFTVVHSQRANRSSVKRQRQESAVASQVNRQSNPPVVRQKVRGITGRSSVVSASLWAANKTIKKAVLCVDNVSLDCNEDDIRAYVTHLGAEIFTCFKTKPRRRSEESIDDVKDRNAFRICVNAQDRDRLLNPVMWPDSVRVSDRFKSNKRSQPGIVSDKRQRIKNSEKVGSATSLQGSTGISGNNKNIVDKDTLLDNTDTVQDVEHVAATAAAGSTEAMVTDKVSGDILDILGEVGDDGDRTTIYQYGV